MKEDTLYDTPTSKVSPDVWLLNWPTGEPNTWVRMKYFSYSEMASRVATLSKTTLDHGSLLRLCLARACVLRAILNPKWPFKVF